MFHLPAFWLTISNARKITFNRCYLSTFWLENTDTILKQRDELVQKFPNRINIDID